MTVTEEYAPFRLTMIQYRRRYGLSQAALAQRMGFDQSSVSRLESGQRKPSRGTVQTMSDAMGLDRDRRRRLFASAGFVPNVDDEPLLADLARFLADDAASPAAKSWVWETLAFVLGQVATSPEGVKQ